MSIEMTLTGPRAEIMTPLAEGMAKLAEAEMAFVEAITSAGSSRELSTAKTYAQTAGLWAREHFMLQMRAEIEHAVESSLTVEVKA